MSCKKILVLGATGAMGRYLIPILAKSGYQVDGVALDDVRSDLPNVNFIKADAKDKEVFRSLMRKKYDAVVDFLIYQTVDLIWYLPMALASTDHYIYLSSYRIYDNKEIPICETSPRLLDTADNIMLRNSDDYSIYKARGENIVKASSRKNWTMIRPAVTYSEMRYQLVTLEAADTVGRAFAGKKVVLPEQARNVQATMSWAGDVAQMISKLLFNEKAIGETFSVCTAEHHTWGEIADYYKDICNLDAVWVDKEDYIRLIPWEPDHPGVRWQLEYDRLFERIMDNSKVLAATGMKQEELMPLYDGLKKEIAACPKNFPWQVNSAMDEYIANLS